MSSKQAGAESYVNKWYGLIAVDMRLKICYSNRIWNIICHTLRTCNLSFLCRLRSIAPPAHRDHFVRRLAVCLYGSHTFLVVTHSYVSQVTHTFLGMLPVCYVSFQHLYISLTELQIKREEEIAKNPLSKVRKSSNLKWSPFNKYKKFSLWPLMEFIHWINKHGIPWEQRLQ